MPDPSVDAAIRDLHALHHLNKKNRRRFRKRSRLITLCTLLVFAGFVFALYAKANRMYALEKFKEPIEREAKVLVEHLHPQIEALAQEVGPVYARLAEEKLEEALPSVHEATRRELHRLADSLASRSEETLDGTLTRLTQAQQGRLEAHFPSLATTAGAEELKRRWREKINVDVEDVLVSFQNRYAADLDRLQATLDEFRPNRFETMDQEQLSRHFVHLWLMRLDRLVTEGDLGGGLGDE